MISDFLPVISLRRFYICIDFAQTVLERHIEESQAFSLLVFTLSRLDFKKYCVFKRAENSTESVWTAGYETKREPVW